MQFLYFIGGRMAAPAAMLEEIGLAAMFGCAATQAPIDSGPGGNSGVLLAAGEGPAPKMRYEADGQRWMAIPKPAETEREKADEPVLYWLGMAKDAPPTPEELARPRLLDGAEVKLGDGNRWLIPRARYYQGAPGLPCRLGLDEQGREVLTVVQRYQGLFGMACEAWAELLRQYGVMQEAGEPQAAMTLGRALEIATAAVGANYRVGRVEAAALGILQTDNVMAILRVLADIEGLEKLIEAESKKNAPA